MREFESLRRRFDLDFDGRISPDEYERGERAFRQRDRDRDGFLTAADFAVAQGSSQPAPPVAAGEASPSEAELFERRIRPVLAEHCYACHSSSAKRLKGELKLDSREAVLAGGVSGPALVPGDVEGSLLVTAVRYEDLEFAMPPKERLPDDVVRDLERWIALGAQWPSPEVPDRSGGGPSSLGREIDLEAGRRFWSFQPPVRREPPATKDPGWAWTSVDRFLLASMEARGVAPVEDADRRTWLRRVTFDLTGLPPTPEEAAAFEADRSEEAHARVVDRLLAAPAFGQRFARHWLDVARYAESSGMDSNVLYPHAWRYRDWVVEAFASDLPFDAFLRKQLAGDLEPARDATERAWNQIATGYLALGPKNHNELDPRQFALDVADEQIDAVSRGMLGLTLACARCHDHKSDPVPIEDYYALAGIFLSSETRYGTHEAPGNRRASALVALPDEARVPDGPRMEALLGELATRGRERMEREREKRLARGEDSERIAREERQRRALADDLARRFDAEGAATAANRLAMGVVEGRVRDVAVLERGELDKPGPVVPRNVPEVLRRDAAAPSSTESGRRELAAWIASPENPLTARVWVNRVWLHLFGRGLVASPDNFGAGGDAPDHPELLDWLATEFVAQGWSTKRLVRALVLSHVYRLDSAHDARHAARDPEAITRWRMAERRLEADAIRDAMLAAAGMLEPAPIGSPTGAAEGVLRREELADALARERPVPSLYLPSLRGHLVDALEVFDAPDAAFVTGDREETSVATQALFLMNDECVLRVADRFAERLLAAGSSDEARIRLAFEHALGRQPSARELGAAKDFLASYGRLAQPAPAADAERRRPRRPSPGEARRGGPPPALAPLADPRRAAWSAFTQALFQSAEFRTIG
jgi:hypothetical protein